MDRLFNDQKKPHVLVLHGLEGSSAAGYVAEIFRRIQQKGWNGTGLNFRSCGGEPNRLARSYHSGETSDALFALRKIRAAATGEVFAVGFSLGGNVLLRLLAETAEHAPLDAAAAISVPYDLDACAQALDQGGGWIAVYRRRFLHSLRRKALEKSKRFPDSFTASPIRSLRGIRAFDDAVTAPLHGFADAAQYYARCSSGPVLGKIARPALLIHALDDPMVPSAIPAEAQANPLLSLLVTQRGGHCGFVGGSIARPQYWAEEQALDFLSLHASSRPP